MASTSQRERAHSPPGTSAQGRALYGIACDGNRAKQRWCPHYLGLRVPCRPAVGYSGHGNASRRRGDLMRNANHCRTGAHSRTLTRGIPRCGVALA